MNTTTQALVFAVASVAAAAAIGMGLADRSAQAATQVVKLERVVVVGKRAEAQTLVVAQLPRVVIEGRRAPTTGDLQVVSVNFFGKAL